jgi:hypothetical protein
MQRLCRYIVSQIFCITNNIYIKVKRIINRYKLLRILSYQISFISKLLFKFYFFLAWTVFILGFYITILHRIAPREPQKELIFLTWSIIN